MVGGILKPRRWGRKKKNENKKKISGEGHDCGVVGSGPVSSKMEVGGNSTKDWWKEMEGREGKTRVIVET